MSFIAIGDRVINMMTVSLVDYNNSDDYDESTLYVHVVGVGAPLVFTGELADQAWAKLRKMAVSLERA